MLHSKSNIIQLKSNVQKKLVLHSFIPLHSLFLSVCSSTRGPDGVKIENADSAVATVTGLEVGTYEFTLAVTDERKLQSSDAVTVIVREG